MRGQGRVYRPKIKGRKRQSKIWMLDYGLDKARHRESSHTTVKEDALELLRQRIGKRKDGTLTGKPDRVTLAQLKAALEQHYRMEKNKSWGRAAQAFKHIEKHFGAAARALSITSSAVDQYQVERLDAGAARDTIRYEVAILTAAFSRGVKKKLLAMRPEFEKVAGGDARQGFFEQRDFAALVVELPSLRADLVRFLYFTGWRKTEGTLLLWAQVDWDDETYQEEDREPLPGPTACIRIAKPLKRGKAREFPIAEFQELRELLLARWRVRDGIYVFHRHGGPFGDFRKVWDTACKKAGLAGRLVHDLRRTAARNLQDEGFSEAEVMLLSGWSTRSMFDRYNIRSAADLRRAVKRRAELKGTQNANNGKQEESVS